MSIHRQPPRNVVGHELTDAVTIRTYDETLHDGPINFGPKGCVDAKIALAATWRVGGVHDQAWHDRFGLPPELGLTPADVADTNVQAVVASDAYWVSADMTALVAAAAPRLPDDTTLSWETIPGTGIAFFQTPITYTMPVGGPIAVSCVQWTLGPSDRWDTGLITRLYAYDTRKGCFWVAQELWVHGDPLAPGDPDRQGTALVVAMLAMLSTSTVAETRPGDLDKPARKRAARAKMADDVRVIYLRHRSTPTGETGTSRFSHQWIVDAHWRSQAHGPGRKLRRPVYIAAHVKGPAGAPLLTGEKVRAFIR